MSGKSQAVLHPELSHHLRLKAITDIFCRAKSTFRVEYVCSGKKSAYAVNFKTFSESDSWVVTPEHSKVQLNLETEHEDPCAP